MLRKKKGEQPEKILIKRAKTGDTQAFASLYQIYLNAIYRYIYYRIDHIQDSQDLTEKVFLTAWETLPAYQDRGNPFSSWLYHIAQFLVAEYYRMKKENAVIDQPSPTYQATNRSSLLRQIIETQDTETLAHAISQLPPEQQEILILRLIEGLNHGEVSQLLSKNPKTCRMIQYRALAALNTLFEVM